MKSLLNYEVVVKMKIIQKLELQRWLNQLKELRQQLFQPSTIKLNHDGDDLLEKILLIKLEMKDEKRKSK